MYLSQVNKKDYDIILSIFLDTNQTIPSAHQGGASIPALFTVYYKIVRLKVTINRFSKMYSCTKVDKSVNIQAIYFEKVTRCT